MKPMPGAPIATSRTGTIRLLYEDDRYLAVSKPPGLLVHRTPLDAHEPENLRDFLKAYREARLDPVHRLDKPTSGVIVFGKDPEAIDHCKRQFEARETEKRYLAVVRGRVDHPGCIGKPLPKGMTGVPKQDPGASSNCREYISQARTNRARKSWKIDDFGEHLRKFTKIAKICGNGGSLPFEPALAMPSSRCAECPELREQAASMICM